MECQGFYEIGDAWRRVESEDEMKIREVVAMLSPVTTNSFASNFGLDEL